MVITYHQIREMTVKMAEQATYVRRLNDMLAEVMALSSKINGLGSALEQDRQAMTHEIRSVEVLEEILKRHVFERSEDLAHPATGGVPAGRQAVDDQPVRDLAAPGAETSAHDLQGGPRPFA